MEGKEGRGSAKPPALISDEMSFSKCFALKGKSPQPRRTPRLSFNVCLSRRSEGIFIICRQGVGRE